MCQLKKSFFIIFVLLFAFSGKELKAQVDSIFLYGSEDLMTNLYKNYSSNDYLNCELKVDGKKKPAKIRVRGDSSREYDKKSLKIKFNYKGKKVTLNLNAEYQDASYMHQHMASWLFRKAGIPAFLTSYKILFYNDKFFGIYLNVESVGKDYLKRNKLSETGNLYKAKRDASNLSRFDNVFFRWEKKNNLNEDLTDLNELIQNLNSVPDSAYLRFIKTTFDYDNLITSMALNSLIGNGSTYYHNYYLFHDISGSNEWIYMPWDLDKSMGSYDTRLPYYYTSWSSDKTGEMPENPFVYRTLLDKQGLKDFKAKVKKLSTSDFYTKGFNDEVKNLKKQLEPFIKLDTTDLVKSKPAWENAIKKMLTYKDAKPGAIRGQFKTFPSLFDLKNNFNDHFGKTAHLEWKASTSTDLSKVTYQVKIGTKVGFDGEDTQEFKNLTQNKLELKGLKPGKYFWHVSANNGKHKINGFNARSTFTIGKAIFLGGKLSKDEKFGKKDIVIFKDLTIPKGKKLTIGKGVSVTVKPGVKIYNYGVLAIEGTEDKPVSFTAKKRGFAWLGIYSEGDLSVEHAVFTGVTGESVIRQIGGKATFNNTVCKFNTVRETASFNKCPAEVLNNLVKESKGEGILFLKCSGICKNNQLYNVPDAIEATYCSNLTITENFLLDAPDDGIDVNYGSNITVTNNIVINCKDKGFSITADPKDSTIFFHNNYIANCNRGVGVEGKGIIYLKGNTYVNNKTQLFLENTDGLTVTSHDEKFTSQKTIDKHVKLINPKAFEQHQDLSLNVKIEATKNNKKLAEITLTSPYNFPVNLNGIRIQAKNKTVYKFNEDVILFPGEKIILKDKQDKKSFAKRVFNSVGKVQNLWLALNENEVGAEKKIEKGNSQFVLFGSLVLAVLIGSIFIYKRKSNA